MKKLLAMSFMHDVTGCNTISGAGQDVQEGGKAVQDAAE